MLARRFPSVSLCLFALLTAAFRPGAARAQSLFVFSDRTLANGNPISGAYGYVGIGQDSSGNLYNDIHADIVAGASMTTLSSQSNSVVNFRGGTITDTFGQSSSRGSSTLNISGGTINNYESFAVGTSTMKVTGGVINGALVAQGNGSIYVSGGSIADINAQGTGIVSITGGTIGQLEAEGSTSLLNVSGGTINGNLFAGGFFSTNIVVNITGGIFTHDILADESSTITISGGLMPPLSSGCYLENENSAVIRLIGTGITFSNPMAGTGQGGAAGTFFTLTGVLANGDVLNTHYFEPVTGETAPARLVISAAAPEPGTLPLFLVASGATLLPRGQQLLRAVRSKQHRPQV